MKDSATSPVFTVEEFCKAHGRISRVLFYKLLKEGRGPRCMKVGRRRLISEESAAEWRASMEVPGAKAA